jgi:ABC transporter DrrB family efflux protein
MTQPAIADRPDLAADEASYTSDREDVIARSDNSARRIVTDVAVLAGRNLRKVARNRRFFTISLALPVTQMLIFVYVLGGISHVPGMSYRQFVLPGVILQALTFTAMGTAIGVASDVTSGLIDRLRSMPMVRFTYPLARSLSDGLRLLMLTVILVLVAMSLGLRFSDGFGNALAVVAVLWLFSVAMNSIAAWVGTSVDPEAAQAFTFLPVLPLLFVSSAFAPVASLPGWMQPIAQHNPVTYAANLSRALAVGGAVRVWLTPYVAWVVGMLVVSTALGARAYQRR